MTATAVTDAQDLERITAWTSGLTIDAVPENLLPTIRACLLYGLAVGVATAHLPVAHQACEALDLEGTMGSGSATRLLDGHSTTPSGAALANGVLLSGRVQGDSHPCGHIGGVVIPTAIAVAEHAKRTGAELLAMLIAGYETGLRIGRDHSADLSRHGFRTTPSYGVFAAAAVTSRGLDFDATTTRNALSTAANLVAGIREYVNAGTDESPLQAGFAARSGVTAALVASTGLRAAPSALHGSAGFYTNYGGAESDHGTRLARELGTEFEFTEVTYKPYPACQFLRGVIRGISELRDQAPEAAPTEIEVRLCPAEADFIGVRYSGPFVASSQTVMSAPFCAALTWETGTAGFAGLRDFDNPAVLSLIERVRIVGDESLVPYQTHLRITLDDGRVLTQERSDTSSAFRVTWEAAVPAARALCDEVGAPRELAEALIVACETIDQAPDVSRLITATRALIASVTP